VISVKITDFNEFLTSILPKTQYKNTQILLECTVESNKEAFLGEYLNYLMKNNVYVLLMTQEGNSSFYSQDITDFHLMTIELTVADSVVTTYEFKKFGQIPLNEHKILYTITNVQQELKETNPLLILFDSLSDMVLWLDFNVTYKLLRKCMSSLRRRKNTSSIFLINKTSHNPEIISSFETLFDVVIVSDALNEARMLGIPKYRQVP
jgi:hypothetical protein